MWISLGKRWITLENFFIHRFIQSFPHIVHKDSQENPQRFQNDKRLKTEG